MQRQTRLKLAIVERGLKNYEVAHRANGYLEAGEELNENAITRIITGRMIPSAPQRFALARALGYDERALFA